MLDGAMIVWFTLTAFSVVFVVWDSLFNGVTSWVQRVAWILVTVYTGPVGAFFYLVACRRPLPGTHDAFTAATWKQALNSEMHCLAGDATGIMVAASIVPVFGLANGWDATIEYLAGFVSGLFIFQALMMIGMYDGDYWKAVRKTFFAETVSMNMVMTGMIPVMLVLGALWAGSESPTEPAFWFRMSIATIVGGIIAYPINYWLVAGHLKHGCMTLPGADTPALGLRSSEPSMLMERGHMQHGGMDHGSGGSGGHAMSMRELPTGQAVGWIAATFAVLLVAVWLTGFVVPVRF
ncbi:DUF4396 domain-containing protein [Microbaculum marinum]|uniref:DUF4396 domain-containing protein n=1 Tax=Microbaculum marinum TaxID=1764581 RepID=A0AAW9RR75_9HYPH